LIFWAIISVSEAITRGIKGGEIRNNEAIIGI
jgi:hypothetical protein